MLVKLFAEQEGKRNWGLQLKSPSRHYGERGSLLLHGYLFDLRTRIKPRRIGRYDRPSV